jgi:hypothetical protein
MVIDGAVPMSAGPEWNSRSVGIVLPGCCPSQFNMTPSQRSQKILLKFRDLIAEPHNSESGPSDC